MFNGGIYGSIAPYFSLAVKTQTDKYFNNAPQNYTLIIQFVFSGARLAPIQLPGGVTRLEFSMCLSVYDCTTVSKVIGRSL